MSNKQFISNLSATYADVRKLDVKKINLKGKSIIDIITENKTIVLDERGTQANDELDIWNSYVTKDENGNVIINRNAKPFEHSDKTISSTQFTTISSAVKVIDNEVLGENDTHLMYWQTDGLTDCYMMFYNQTSFTTFSSDLSSLTNGWGMFWNCFALESFSSDLSSLTDGENMFMYCENLTSFNSDLSSLTNGDSMFSGCENLTSFNSDSSGSPVNLSSLTNGSGMFWDCFALESFSSDLSSLTNGDNMFTGCNKLTSFNSYLSSLTTGNNMFSSCKLDAQSVADIIHFLPTNESKGNIGIGIDIPNTDAAKQAFAEECDCDDWAELNKDFDDKNWAVQWQFHGEASTFDLRNPRPYTAVYAKLEEVIMPTEEEIAAAKQKREHIQIPHYQYTSQDGSKFYNIHWYHDSNTNNEGYDYFESLEMATIAYSVIAKA